jgi:hypothetical protein
MMASASSWIWSGIWCLLGALPAGAHACSCGSPSLGGRYARTDNVFVAMVTGGALDIGSNHATTSFTFEVTELFKGRIPFDRLTSTRTSCATSLDVGYEYLFFVQDDGSIGLCSGIEVVSPPEQADQHGLEYLQALRSLKAGDASALVEPWTFSDREGVCSLYTRFVAESREGFLRITFRYAAPQVPDDHPSAAYLVPGFSEVSVMVWIPEEVRPPALTVQLGDRAFTASWGEDEHSSGYFALRGQDVVMLTRMLDDAENVRIANVNVGASPLVGTVPTLKLGTGAQDMLRCMGVSD